jgi:exonuclease III
MAEHVKILSLNCRGLNSSFKRKKVFHFLRKKKANIYCLQDVHFTSEQIQLVKQQWGYNECFISPFRSNARGTAILFNNNFNFTVLDKTLDDGGNFVALKVQIDDTSYTIITLYGPNRDSPEFFDKIEDLIKNFDSDEICLCGDWNLIQNPRLDTFNYKNINNPRARDKVLKLMETFDLKDPWRVLNYDVKRYTWRQPTPLKQARLDFFLISHDMLPSVDTCDILPSINSDHSLIKLTLTFSKISRGHGFWKFNNSLLHDRAYIELVKTTIRATLDQYKIEQDGGDVMYSIDDQLLWEVLLLMIRGKTIYYSSTMKKINLKMEKDLETKLLNLEEEIDSATTEQDKNTVLENINQIKDELDKINDKRIQGMFIRSKAKWIEQGEKPTKYFLKLEARNFLNKSFMEIEKNDGTILKDCDDILKETKLFYERLYTQQEVSNLNLTEYFKNVDIQKLNEYQSNNLEGELTNAEILTALKNMKNEKSPGPDGFTAEFFKFFWNDLGTFLVKSLNNGYIKGNLSISQRQGLITCIPKGNKPKRFLKNWRPISLLNVSYKLGAAAVANRIKNILPNIINEDQKGFMSGRYIGEVTRLIYDLMEYTETFQIPGLLLLIDFEKAFDTVDRNYIRNVLAFFNFGPSIIKWVDTFYNDIESSVLVNGFASPFFKITRGCRQGDPISPYIFLLCVEIMGIMIRNNKTIKGIKVGSMEYILSQFADDTTLTLDGTEKCLYAVFNILQFFARFSGLKVNVDKTKLIWIGSKKRSRLKLCKEWKFDWSQTEFTLLGINFDIDLECIVDKNYTEKLDQIEKQMNLWSARTLTPYGRNTVLKSLLLPKLNHLFAALPNPSDIQVDTLQRICFKFIWKGKPDKIKRFVMMSIPKHGGIKVPNIKEIITSQKLGWIRRLFVKMNKWQYLFFKNMSNEISFWLLDSYYIYKHVVPAFSNTFGKTY